MRRWFVFVILALLVSGCSDIEDVMGLFKQPEEEDSLPSAYIIPTPAAVYPPEMSTGARMLARGEMVVGVRYDLEPLSYITSDSELAGLEIDLARELARRWLGNPEAVRFRQVRSDSAFQHLEDGTVDIVLAGVTHAQETETRADFSPPYFRNGLAFLTFPDTGIQGVAELNDRALAVVDWTGSQAALQAAASLSTTYVIYEHFFDVVEALQMRQVEAYADQRHRLERARRMVAGTVIVGQVTAEPVALAHREDDPFFRNLVMLTFYDMVVDGTRDALYARWLPGTSPPELPSMIGTAPTPALADSPQQRSTLDVIGRIGARGNIVAGYFLDRWPYSGDRADGVPTGFEVRLLERVAERWLGSRQAVTFVPVTKADAFARLQQGELDLLVGNWVRRRDAELEVDFSISILDDGVSIFSLATAPVEDIAALNGQAVGIVSGSAGEAALPGISQSAGVALSPVPYPTFAEALAGLQGGAVQALLTERRPALDVHFREVGYYITDQRYTLRPVAYVLPQGDADFRDLLNLTLLALESNGTYNELYGLWFDDAVPALERIPGQPAIPLLIPTGAGE